MGVRHARRILAGFVVAWASALMLVVPGAATAAGTEVAFPMTTGWHVSNIANDGFPTDPNWYLPTSNEWSDWDVHDSPFGSPGGCLFPAKNTNWPINSRLFLVKAVTLPANATHLQFSGTIDNDVEHLWVNGHDVYQVFSGNCVTNNIHVTVPDAYLTTGGTPNVIAVQAHDYGAETFFGMDATYDLGATATPAQVTLISATPTAGGATVRGLVTGAPGQASITFSSKAACNDGGHTSVGTASVTIPAGGSAYFNAVASVSTGHLVANAGADDSNCIPVGLNNTSWPNAAPLTGSTTGFISTPGESRWYKFTPGTDAQVTLALSNLPANYDLAFFKDIGKAFPT